MTAEIIDRASEREEQFREQAIAAHRINRNAVSATHCVDCDDAIPDLRRVNVPGCQRCASCQQDEELRMKNGRV
ncbi:TraR/DksA family transcriptional regulator [Citrobacter braakii]|uniref:TraR/DksA family transcriptional regulator n=1 Tax=Citrobacter braakii TaxID=57706 RepID=UPI0011ECDFD2|nr:TraR/DksA family transcriptional regulator [Citrobacter braakii]